MSDKTADPTAPPVFSFSVLIFLVFTTLAICCCLISFLLAKNNVTEVQQSGLYYWTTAAPWSNPTPAPVTATATAVWYSYSPGKTLQLVLTPAPIHHAAVSLGAVLLAGLLTMPVIFLWHRNRFFLREVFILLGLASLGFGFYAIIPDPPTGFTVDLEQRLITVTAGAPGAQVQITPSLTLTIVSNSITSLTPDILIVQNGDGGVLTLAAGAPADLNTLCNLTMTFINSNGNQV